MENISLQAYLATYWLHSVFASFQMLQIVVQALVSEGDPATTP